jgi:uncharacterized protein YbjQ (UPF0145 family)
MDLLIQLGVFLVLLAIGFTFGRVAERRHFERLAEREAELRDILVFSERQLPVGHSFDKAALVTGSVVIAEDYFKKIAASLKSLFGGRLTAYESLLDRGRREAIIRMKEDARRHGATMVFNVRLETASMAETSGSQSPMFSAEFIAYGTALVPQRPA